MPEIVAACVRCVIALCLFAIGTGAYGQSSLSFDLRNSVEMTTFASHPGIGDGAILKSPDGHYFAFVTSHGSITSNRVESCLWVVSEAEIQRYTKRESTERGRLRLMRMSCMQAVPQRRAFVPRSPVLFDVAWAPDSSAVFFLVEYQDGKALYKRFMQGTHPVRMSRHGESVQEYAVSQVGVVYSSFDRGCCRSTPNRQQSTSTTQVSGKSLPDILFPTSRVAFSTQAVTPDLWFVGSSGRLSCGMPVAAF